MKQKLLVLLFIIPFQHQPVFTFAQNIGIGTNTPLQKLHVEGNTHIKDSVSIGIVNPKAKLDVLGTALFRGQNQNTLAAPAKSGVEFFLGRASNGALPAGLANGEIAFNYGEAGGGYKHFITTHHNFTPLSTGNAINFYINNSFLSTASAAPGSGNLLQLAITANGVGVGKALPTEMLDVEGNANINGKLVVVDSVVVQGDMRVVRNVSVAGYVNMGYQMLTSEYSIPPSSAFTIYLHCPGATRAMGGGGGIKDVLSDQYKDILIHYNGPDPKIPGSGWVMAITNKNNSEARTVLIHCSCARIN